MRNERVDADISQVADAVDSYWRHRATSKELARGAARYRLLIYDAFEVTATLTGAGVTIEVVGVAPRPLQPERFVTKPEQLGAVLESIDQWMRSNLPRGYVAELDALTRREAEVDAATAGRRPSPQERMAMVASTANSSSTTPGPTITLSEVPDILRDHFGERVRVLDDGSAPSDHVTAELDGVLSFGIYRDGQYGAITAALLLGDRAVVTVLGNRLIARHPDERSLRELLDLIDLWLDLRVGEASPYIDIPLKHGL
jgi:hypothetical protein